MRVRAPVLPLFVFFRGRDGDWYWRFLSGGNRREIARSSEGYRRPSMALKGAQAMINACQMGYDFEGLPKPRKR